MCEPATIILATASFVTTAGSAVAQHRAQNKQAKATEQAANEAAKVSNRDISIRSVEETVAANREVEAIEQQAMSASAMARLSAIEAGVSGNSVAAQAQTIDAERGKAVRGVNENLSMILGQLDRERGGVDAARRGRIAANPGANPLATALTIAGAGIDFGTTLATRKPPKAT